MLNIKFILNKKHQLLFFILKKKLLTATCVVGNGFSKINIGKFYKCKWLDEYPKALHPLYDKEVTDTLEIMKAGFSREDLKKNEWNWFGQQKT